MQESPIHVETGSGQAGGIDEPAAAGQDSATGGRVAPTANRPMQQDNDR
jgi:hypothetical protein